MTEPDNGKIVRHLVGHYANIGEGNLSKDEARLSAWGLPEPAEFCAPVPGRQFWIMLSNVIAILVVLVWVAVRRWKDRSANGTSASVGRAARTMRSNRRSCSDWMRPDRGGAEELPIHAQGRIFLVGADRPSNRSSRGPSAPWHGIPSEAADVDHG